MSTATWGKFRVIDNDAGVDGVSGTDGIDLLVGNLPLPFEGGLLVVQDDYNREPVANQNFKLLRWTDVLEAMGLPQFATDQGWGLSAPSRCLTRMGRSRDRRGPTRPAADEE